MLYESESERRERTYISYSQEMSDQMSISHVVVGSAMEVEIGVTETRLLTIGMPYLCSMESPTATMRPAERQILS